MCRRVRHQKSLDMYTSQTERIGILTSYYEKEHSCISYPVQLMYRSTLKPRYCSCTGTFLWIGYFITQSWEYEMYIILLYLCLPQALGVFRILFCFDLFFVFVLFFVLFCFVLFFVIFDIAGHHLVIFRCDKNATQMGLLWGIGYFITQSW